MQKNQKIFIASDHAGFDLKAFLIEELSPKIELVDLGCDSSDVSVDYPDFAAKLAKRIKTENDRGILICGSGIGISIAANRFKHIRAALCQTAKEAKLARFHNDANVICLGARLVTKKSALAAIKMFLKSEFEGGRHVARVAKLSK